MDSIADFISRDDEIKRLNDQINMIAGFYSDFYKNRIINTEKRLSSQVAMKHKANKSRDKLIADKVNVKKLMIKLKAKGLLLMSDKEIADTIFCTKKSIADTRSRMDKI